MNRYSSAMRFTRWVKPISTSRRPVVTWSLMKQSQADPPRACAPIPATGPGLEPVERRLLLRSLRADPGIPAGPLGARAHTLFQRLSHRLDASRGEPPRISGREHRLPIGSDRSFAEDPLNNLAPFNAGFELSRLGEESPTNAKPPSRGIRCPPPSTSGDRAASEVVD